MIVTYSITEDQKPTPEQIKRIREAAKRPVIYDEDCPELNDEQLSQFRRVNSQSDIDNSVQNSV